MGRAIFIQRGGGVIPTHKANLSLTTEMVARWVHER